MWICVTLCTLFFLVFQGERLRIPANKCCPECVASSHGSCQYEGLPYGVSYMGITLKGEGPFDMQLLTLDFTLCICRTRASGARLPARCASVPEEVLPVLLCPVLPSPALRTTLRSPQKESAVLAVSGTEVRLAHFVL